MPSAVEIPSASRFVADSAGASTWLDDLRDLVARELRPQVGAVDREGAYPREFMQQLGELGGFAQSCPADLGGAGRGLKAAIQAIEVVSQDCLSTGFCVWCQTICGWYIQNGESHWLKSEVLPDVISGRRLAGTGLSNPMKHFAGIEKLNLSAERREGGFVLNGALPWVSNVGRDHFFAVVARTEGEGDSSKYLMAIVPGDAPGLTLGDGGHFIALEGSSTHSCQLRDVFVPDAWVLAQPCDGYVERIRCGFMLAQTGMALGLVQSCVELMRRADKRTGHVNCFLPDQAQDIESDLDSLRQRIYALADEIGCGQGLQPRRPGLWREVIQARADAAELSLRASQATMLYAGASGYRTGGAAERKLRESYFVAIVTPALKHLKKLLATMPAN